MKRIFGQQANDLFVVRVAGNVLGDEIRAASTMPSIWIWHGAAAGRAGAHRLRRGIGRRGRLSDPGGYLGVAANFPLQSIISSLMAPVRGAVFALAIAHGERVDERPGYRQALIETTVVLNTALSAAVLIHNFHDALGIGWRSITASTIAHRTVGLPDLADPDNEWQEGLFRPPTDEAPASPILAAVWPKAAILPDCWRRPATIDG